MSKDREDDFRYAVHESGHVWGYAYCGLTFPEVTLRPPGDARGLVRAPDPLPSPPAWRVINACGPIAVALLDLGKAPAAEDLVDWQDRIWKLVFHEGGLADFGRSDGILGLFGGSDSIATRMHEDWDGILRLARELVGQLTLTGDVALNLLGPTKYRFGITEARPAEK